MRKEMKGGCTDYIHDELVLKVRFLEYRSVIFSVAFQTLTLLPISCFDSHIEKKAPGTSQVMARCWNEKFAPKVYTLEEEVHPALPS